MKPESRRRAVRVFSIAIIVVVLLVLLSGGVSAAWWNPIGWVIKAIELVVGVIKALINLVQMVVELKPVEVVTKIIGGFVKGAVEKFFDAMKYFLTLNPTVYCPPAAAGCKQNPIVGSIAPTIMTIIQPLYVTMALFTGIYYIFAAMEPRRRAAAKNMLLKLLVGMVIVGLSLPIFQLILDISSALTEEVFNNAYKQFKDTPNTSIAVFAAIIVALIVLNPILLVIAILVGVYVVIAVLLVMGVRYVAVLILAILFPATLFLYFFDATKNLGASLVYQTLSWIFVPVVQAFMIVITFFAFEAMLGGGAATVTNPTTMESTVTSINPTTAVLMFFMVLGGLAGVIIAPLVMMQWMKWVGGAIAGYGALKIPQATTKEEFWGAAGLTALGGSMMGGGSKGMQYGATQAAYMAQQFAPSFGDTASWRDVMPSFGEIKGWFSRGSGQGGGGSSAPGGGGGGGSAPGGGGASSQPWVGAAARARAAGGRGRGLVSDFFKTYATALNFDRIKSAELMDKYGSGSGQQSASGSGGAGGGGGIAGERGIPLTTATTLAGSERNRPNQYTTIYGDSSGARGGYLGKVEGPPFFSIPLYFFGGLWGNSLKKAATAFKEGKYAKGIGISLFETFKVFSPFRPVRHLGRILYTAIPEFIPPFIPFPVPFVGWTLRDVAWWGSRKMSGVGLGQMASRGSWNLSLAAIEGDFNGALNRLKKAKPAERGKVIEDMDEAAKKYAKKLDEIREGAGIRKMGDLDFYNKKMEQLRDHNKELYFSVNWGKNPISKKIESREDVINAAVKTVGDAKGDRDKLESTLKKDLDKVKDDDKTKEADKKVAKIRENDMTLLLFDYIKEKHGEGARVDKNEINTFLGSSDKGISDFMDYNAAMKFGVGVSEWGFDRDKYEEGKVGVWSRKNFDLKEMEDYIKKHKDTGASLVIEREGELRMSANRLLYGAAYNCATQNEVTILPDGRVLPNIYIFDAVDTVSDPNKPKPYAFVNQDGSEYVEIMKTQYESGGGKQPIWGEKDRRTRQYLDANGSGFRQGLTYDPADGFKMRYNGEPIDWDVDDHRALLTSMEAHWAFEKAKDKLGDTHKTTIKVEEAVDKLRDAETALGDARHALGAYGLSSSEKAGREKALKKAEDEVVKAKRKAFEDVRKADIDIYEKDIAPYLEKRYGGTYLPEDMKLRLEGGGYSRGEILGFGIGADTQQMRDQLLASGFGEEDIRKGMLDGYKSDVEKATDIRFNDNMTGYLRQKGYHEREIDHLRLVLYNNPRYRELIERGETVDVRIADKPENPYVSWVNTDKLGRRSLTINVGHYAYGKADHQSTPAEASLFMRHLEDGDILAHEATHDRIREQYGQASYTEIWDDFARGGDRLKNVFTEGSLNDVRVGIADALRLNPDELADEKKLRGRLRKRLTKEDLGFMLSEGLADVGANGRSIGRGGEQQEVYNDGMVHFAASEATRISNNAKVETTPGDVSLLARMKSLASQTTDYVDDSTQRAEMDRQVEKTKKAVGDSSLRGFDTQVNIYNAIHSNAVLI